MTDGLIFYWICWILWIIITFIMKKESKRTILACWLLAALLCSDIHVTTGNFHISLTFLILLAGATVLQIRINHYIYQIFATFTLMTGYMAMLLWEKFAPVWLFLPRFVLIPLLCFIILHLMLKNAENKVAAVLFALCAGEILITLILAGYGLQKEIGEMAFFDTLLVTVAITLCADLFKKGRRVFSTLFVHRQTKERWDDSLPKTAFKGSVHS